MKITNKITKIAIVGVLCMAFFAQPARAYAYWGGGGWGGGWHSGWGGGWHGYGWSGHGWGWGWPVAAGVALGAGATAVWIANHQYYYYDGAYYDYTPQGYVVVTPPATDNVLVAGSPTTVAAPAPQPAVDQTPAGESITINIPNSSGGYSAVILKRSGNGYVGPQGEYYPQMPKVLQLQLMYGNGK